jgi:hypothetical protein
MMMTERLVDAHDNRILKRVFQGVDPRIRNPRCVAFSSVMRRTLLFGCRYSGEAPFYFASQIDVLVTSSGAGRIDHRPAAESTAGG